MLFLSSKNKSIIHKILSFTLAIVILTTTVNIGLLLLSRHRITTLKIEDQENYIDLYAYSTDHIFTTLTNILTYIENSHAVQDVFSARTYPAHNYIKVQQDIFNLLSTFTITSDTIQEALIFSTHHEFLYTNNGLVKPETFYTNRFQSGYEGWLDTISKAYPSPALIKLPDTLSTSPISSPYYLIQTISSSQKEPCNIILTLTNVFDHTLKSIPSDERQIFVLNEAHEILASNSPMPLDRSFEFENQASISQSSYSPENGLTSVRASTLDGLYYVICTPKQLLFKGLNTIFIISILISLALMGTLLLLSVKISSRLYAPFRTTLDVLKDINTTPSSLDSVNELEFIKNQVLQIASINHNLKNKINDSTQLIFEAILLKLIMGNENANKALIETSHYGVGFGEGLYNTFVIRMDLPTTSEELFFTEYRERLHQLVLSHTSSSTLKIIETRQNELTVVSYYNHANQYTEAISAYGLIASELTQLIPHATFYIGCSPYTTSIIHLNDCYQQSLQMIRHRNIKSTDAIILEDISHYDIPPYLPNHFEAEIEAMLNSEQKESAKKYILYILERNYKLEISMSAYLRVCVTINNFFMRYCKSKNKSPQDFILLHHDDYLYSVERIDEILLTNLILSFKYVAKKELSEIPIIEKIESYVDDHFTEYINLSTVAQHLGYTSNYLSKFFKQEKGINFTDYINRKRIAFAKNALTHSLTSIKQIATDSGFSSSTLFIRTFEKYEGVTPGEYRKLMSATQYQSS